MAVETAADRAAFVATDDFGTAATYTPAGGSAASVNVLLDKPHTLGALGDLGVVQVGYRALVRADDVAAPADGDSLVVGAQTFRVRKAEQDVAGGLWFLDLELQ